MSEIVAPNLGMSYGWNEGESGWKPGVDNDFKRLDSLVMPSVKDKDLNTPPGSPANGDRYIVGPSPTGAWASQAGKVATYEVSTWVFYTPKNGWVLFVEDEAVLYRYLSSAWVKYAGIVGGSLAYRLLKPADFGAATKVLTNPFSDEGAYEYINLPAAGDTDLSTYFVVPEDYASTSSWKAYLVPQGTSTTTLTMTFGITTLVSNDFPEETTAFVSATVTPTGVSGRIQIATLSTPSHTLTPGALAKVVLRRINAADANPDDQRLLGLLLSYAR